MADIIATSSPAHAPTSTIKRFFALLAPERQAITYIYLYAILAGLLTLSLPLGVQSVIGFVSSGQISTSVIVLLLFITLGTLLTGGLQIMQLSLAEHIQQRLFTRMSYAFAHRITHLQPESLLNHYSPELMNRFFDVITIQKGLTKLLIEFSAALLQLLFGLILLSFYHPYFIAFGLLLILILFLILRLTGEKGLKTSLYESKYKYQLVGWLEEMARTLYTFKLSGQSTLGMDKTDDRTSHYLHARQGHFRILMVQYYSFVGFKTLITGLLLVLGCVLLISKEINLGQFVASEIIIITIINAVEKVLIKLDVVYDVLTSAEKIGVVTDLPTEPTHGLAFEDLPVQPGISVRLSNLRYRYPNEKEYTLKDIDLTLAPGEKICLSGPGGSGKTTLLRIILGLFPSYEGVITYNNVSLRDLNKPSLLRHIGEDCVPQSLFEGTVLENITMGQTSISVEDVLRALDDVGLNEFVQTLPQGVHTLLIGRGEQLPFSAIRKLTLARSLAKKPQLLLLDDFLPELGGREKEAILQRIMQRFESATIVIVSNDPMVMRTCHRVLEIRDGELLPEKHPSDSNSLAG